MSALVPWEIILFRYRQRYRCIGRYDYVRLFTRKKMWTRGDGT